MINVYNKCLFLITAASLWIKLEFVAADYECGYSDASTL